MAVFQFSALADGQSIAFNPNSDVLNVTQGFSAGDFRATAVGANTRIDFIDSGQVAKSVTLQNTSPLQLATTNVTFANGSLLLLGDNSTAQNDNVANTLTGTAGRDLLQGFGGADTMNGGAGDDTYIVGTGDVLSDTGGIDTVVTDINWTLGTEFERVQLIGTGNISATGNNGANLALGNSGNNYFNMRAGNDTIQAGAGNDWIDMSAFGTPNYGDDVIDGGAGVDTVNFGVSAGQQSAITVDLGAGTIRGGGVSGSGSVNVTSVERVIGAAFSDSFKGTNAAETFEGREGNDTLSGMGGNDTLSGGAGQDSFLFAAAPGIGNTDLITDFVSATDKLVFDSSVFATLGAAGNFAAGDARFAAGAGFTSGRDASDRIVYNTTTGQLFYDADGSGSGASQLVATLQGAPSLTASDIAVQGSGGSGGMLIEGSASPDHLVGGPGNDTLRGNDGQDTLEGLGGNDLLEGGALNDTLLGGDGDDTLISGASWTFGTEFLDGGNGNDRLEGSPLWNDMRGSDGSDYLLGGGLDDTLDGGSGADTLVGGEGYDLYVVTAGDVVIETGTGPRITDTVRSDGSWTLESNVEILELTGTGAWSGIGNSQGNVIIGNDAANYLNPGTGEDRVLGMGGNDTIDLPAGDAGSSDQVDGGNGIDLLNFAGYLQSGITVDLEAGTVAGGGAGGSGRATVTDIENVIGDAFNDQLSGNDAANVLEGRAGADTLGGGRGNDTLVGGAGGDVFAFATAPGAANADRISDFASGGDKIRLDGATHPNLGAEGNFAAGDARFASGVGFTSGRDATDRVVYDTSTGNLYYDADGNGTGAAQLIATLEGAPTLAATDIVAQGGPNTGTEGNDSITGTDGDDFIDGRGGNDALEGRAGNDTLLGGTGNDSIIGGRGADSIVGGGGDDTLDAASGADTWSSGGAEPDTGLGDTVDGGLGDDVYYMQANDVVSDSGGIDTIRTDQFEYTLPAGFENLTFTSFALFFDGEGVRIRYSGNELDNVITSAGFGLESSDTLDGGVGNDTLLGGGGSTTFRFSLALDNYGMDRLDGRVGEDGIDFSDARSAIVADLRAGTLTGGSTGGAGSATLASVEGVRGGAFDDRIVGASRGVDRSFFVFGLHGGGGNDTIEGVAGSANELFGDAGNDRLVARGINEYLTGGAGTDAFVFARTPGDDPNDFDRTTVFDFASGADKIVLDGNFHSGSGPSGNFAAGDERFHAAAGATSGHDATDRVVFNTSTGELFYDADGSGAGQAQLIAQLQSGATVVATDIAIENGALGGQTINGTAGNDSLVGTNADDTINGFAGNDTLRGLGGNDFLEGGAGVDSLDGGLGDDTYVVTAGDVLVDAGGTDGVITDVSWTLGADFENISLTGTGNISATGHNGDNVAVGNSGNNYFNMRAGDDTIQGGAGNDWIDMSAFGTASYGDDVIDGGAGFDTVNFAISAAQQSAITVQLWNNEIFGGGQGGAGSVRVTGVERVIGTAFNDWLFGSSGADSFEGRDGNDSLWGSTGNDTLTGGNGQDRFAFSETPGAGNVDLITDFISGTDKVAIDNSVTVFNALGPDGNFAAGDPRFAAGAGFTSGRDASDRIVYNTSSGQLFYDADGSGAGAAQLIATLQGNPAIAATDITVI